MAIYHFHAQIIGRSDGRSSVGAAAYRLGVALADELTGEMFDYTRKQGVDSWHTLSPAGAPDWVNDPATLWNAVEAAEKRKDSQLCREIDVALPAELTHDQMKTLALDFAREQWVERGMVAVLAFHDLDSHNPHFHAMLTMRDIGPEGFGKKNRDWNAKGLLETWREQWATHANTVLEAAGHSTRIDHRTLDAQKADATEREDFAAAAALDRAATKHEGPAVTQARRCGRTLPRAQRNDRIAAAAGLRHAAHMARFAALQAQAKAEGRLAPIDEQAAHARALLERTREGQARLRKAYNPTNLTPRRPHGNPEQQPQRRALGPPLTRDSGHSPSNKNNRHGLGLGSLPAVRPLDHSATIRRGPGRDAGGPGPDAARAGGVLRPHAQGHPGSRGSLQRLRTSRNARSRSLGSRPSQGRGGGSGGQLGKSDRREELIASMQAAASTAAAIAAILQSAEQFLRQSANLSPWQKATARAALDTHARVEQQHKVNQETAAKEKKARTLRRHAEAEANEAPEGRGRVAAARRAMGVPSAQDKAAARARENLAKARARVKRYKTRGEAGRILFQQLQQEAEKARADFAQAFGIEVPRFPSRSPSLPSGTSASQPAALQKIGMPPPRPPGSP